MKNAIYLLTLFTFMLTSCEKSDSKASADSGETTEKSETAAQPSNQKGELSSAEERSAPEAVQVGLIGKWHPQLDDSGCSCTFRSDKEDFKKVVLVSDWDKYACMNINGETLLLEGSSIDADVDYAKFSQEKVWVTLNEKGTDYLFDQAFEAEKYDWEDGFHDLLMRVGHTMETMPEEIPLKMVGTIDSMQLAKTKDIYWDAWETVRMDKERGQRTYTDTFYWSSDQYGCYFIGNQYGTTDGGGSEYEGEIILKSTDGTVIYQQKAWGGCGC